MKYTNEQFIEILTNNNITNISQIFELNIASDSTIRRKIKSLEELGYLKTFHGGKIEIIPVKAISIKDSYRSSLHEVEKEEIALQAALKINENEIIFIDNGTTVRKIFKYLKGKNITIYTNGYNHIKECEKHNIKINLIPGEILYKEASIVGEESLVYISQLKFDKAFIGANGIDDEYITTPNKTEALFKKLVLKQSNKGYILIDKSKFNVSKEHVICSKDEYIIITNS